MLFLRLRSLLLTCSLLLPALGTSAAAVTPAQVSEHYADLAHAIYQDSLSSARQLQQAIEQFLQQPTAATLAAARLQWKQARVPYQQSEVFRFGNPVVDDWEGQINAWPLDEGLIDYVAADYQAEMGNIGAQLNLIASPRIELGGTVLEAAPITPELLASFNELGGSEANVATGYHAIEFLLWGQDLNATGPGAGARPHTDYLVGEACSNGHCERRRDYLRAVTQLLVDDLQYMVTQWQPGGDYRTELLAQPEDEVLTRAFYGMGSLSLGELAGERMKVPLAASSPEDEHDCFSDNTHNSHFYNARGIRNVYLGEYQRLDGSRLSGPSLADLVAARKPDLDAELRTALDNTEARMQTLVTAAESGAMAFDQMIDPGNARGNALIQQAIDTLVAQTRLIEKSAMALGIYNLNPDTADHSF